SIVEEAPGDAWPLFRGDTAGTGVATGTLPSELELLWKFEPDDGMFQSAAAIADGVVYIADANEFLFALDLATGEEKWRVPNKLGYLATPAVRDGKVYVGDG